MKFLKGTFVTASISLVCTALLLSTSAFAASSEAEAGGGTQTTDGAVAGVQGALAACKCTQLVNDDIGVPNPRASALKPSNAVNDTVPGKQSH